MKEEKTGRIPVLAKKAASATILSLLGSSFIMSIAAFLVKDTIDRVNSTIDNVHAHSTEMIKIDGSIKAVNARMTSLDDSVSRASNVFSSYVTNNASEQSKMKENLIRVTEKLISIDRRCEKSEDEIRDCDDKINRMHGR